MFRKKLPLFAMLAVALLGVGAVGWLVFGGGDARRGDRTAGLRVADDGHRAGGSVDDGDGDHDSADGPRGRNGGGTAGPDGANGSNGTDGSNGSDGIGSNGQNPDGAATANPGGVTVNPGAGFNGSGPRGGGGGVVNGQVDGDGRRFGPTSDYDGKSSGAVERDGAKATEDDEPQQQGQTEWVVQFVDGETGQPAVGIAAGLFRPEPPMEIRSDGLYGNNQPLPVNTHPTDTQGRVVMSLDDALTFAGVIPDDDGSITGTIGVYVDEVAYEQHLAVVPIAQPNGPVVVTLNRAHFVEIKVRHEVSNQPLPDAIVELWRYDPANPDGEAMDVLNLRTDSTGAITSRIIPGRSYAFRVRCDGYATTAVERFTCHSRDVHYNLPMYPGNFIAGIVTDEGGAPVAGAKVTAMLKGNDGVGSDEATTDAWGQFTVTSVPHSDFTSDVWVTVKADGFSTLVTTVVTNVENAHLILKVDGEVTGVVLPPPGTELRQPVRVLVSQKLYGQKNPTTHPPFPVNADGTFTLGGIVEGKATLVAENDFGEVSNPLEVTFAAGTTQEIQLQLNPSAGAFVRIHSDAGPVPGIQVAIADWRGVSAIDGTMHFTDLRPGDKVKVRVVPMDGDDSLVMAADGETYFVPAEQEIKLQSGMTTEVGFTLVKWTPPPTLTPVQITLRGDRLVGTPGEAKVTVSYGSGGNEIQTVPVAFENGIAIFQITLRSDATSVLEFTHPDYQTLTIPHEELMAAGAAGGADDDGNPLGGNLAKDLVRQASVSIQVVDPGASNIAEVGVQIHQNGKQIANGKTDAAGRISFTNLNPGPIRISAFKHGYRQAIFDIQVPVEQIFEPIHNEDGSSLEVADTGNGTSTSPGELKLVLSNAGDFHVVVTNESGDPAVGATILVMRNQKEGQPLEIFNLGKLDGQGGKVVRLHWDVQYQLVVYNDTSIAYANFFNDPADPLYSIELQMEPRNTVTGKVVDGANNGKKNVEVRLVPIDGPLRESGNYFAVRTNDKGEFSIPVPSAGTFRAELPDEKGTTPIEPLIPGQQGVVIVAGQ